MGYGGFGGGNTQQGGGFTQETSNYQGSQGAGGERRKIDTEQSLICTTIKQLSEAPVGSDGSKLQVDGREPHQVQLVGQIRNINKQSTNTTYQIDDSTGVIEVKWWQQTDSGFQQNQYVRVVGRINIFQGKRSINAFKVFPITDFNEVTCHFLQVIEAHIYATTKASGAQASTLQTGFQQQTVQPTAMAGVGGTAPTYQANAGMGEMAMEENSFSPMQQQVLNAIKQFDESGADEGVKIDVVMKHLDPSGQKVNEIREAIGFLADEGHLYSTIDEEHYKATTS